MTITVLLWGNRWWLPRQPSPVPFADVATAADALAAAWADQAKTIRLIFQPDEFESTFASCPNGNRATLALALSDQHPVLDNPKHAWSHEPILPGDGAFNTLLHYETAPVLFALVARLEEHGFAVQSAWPMPAWLNALPDDLADSGSTTVAAIDQDRICLYCDCADGRRVSYAWRKDDPLTALAGFLRVRFHADPGCRVLLLATGEHLLQAIDAVVPLAGQSGVQHIPLPAALAKTASLPPRHPAQLLPPPARFTALRAVVATSAALLLLALVFGGRLARDYHAGSADAAVREHEKQALRAEVTHLRANAAEISALRAAVAVIRPNPPAAAFLAKLSATLPTEIVLRSLRMTGGEFVVDGWVAPKTPPAVGEAWIVRLTAANASWHLMGPFTADASGAFRLRGSFR